MSSDDIAIRSTNVRTLDTGAPGVELKVANRSFIDKRRSHLIDVYTQVSPHSIERVATYSTKTHSLTFYNFPLNYTKLWESEKLFKQLFPIILKNSITTVESEEKL